MDRRRYMFVHACTGYVVEAIIRWASLYKITALTQGEWKRTIGTAIFRMNKRHAVARPEIVHDKLSFRQCIFIDGMRVETWDIQHTLGPYPKSSYPWTVCLVCGIWFDPYKTPYRYRRRQPEADCNRLSCKNRACMKAIRRGLAITYGSFSIPKLRRTAVRRANAGDYKTARLAFLTGYVIFMARQKRPYSIGRLPSWQTEKHPPNQQKWIEQARDYAMRCSTRSIH